MGYFDTLRLEKGMYQEIDRSFSQVLESLDPSERYVGTPLEGLDAFQRQLKRFDIKVKGAQSDTVEKFFATTESAVLFPEYVARVVQRGMEESDIVPMITASVTRVDDEEQVGNTRANLRKRGRLLVPVMMQSAHKSWICSLLHYARLALTSHTLVWRTP